MGLNGKPGLLVMDAPTHRGSEMFQSCSCQRTLCDTRGGLKGVATKEGCDDSKVG